MTINLKLKELYIQKGKTQKQVSEEANIREATLSGLANNRKGLLDIEILDRLCEYFEIKDINEIVEFIPAGNTEFDKRLNQHKNRK